MSNHVKVLLIGAGCMGKEYWKVLNALNIDTQIICRSEYSAKKFQEETGKEVVFGNLEQVIKKMEVVPTKAIVAVNVECLKEVVITLIENGIRNVLVEKPAGLDRDEISQIVNVSSKFGAKVHVAYNRRFYASTEKAMKIIERDGGVSSFNFEFTEWSSSIEKSDNSREVKEEWLLANSSHVIDLAFFLGGFPVEMVSFREGELSWHSRASKYTGAGRTINGALFSYQANWEAPGRWGVEILTSKHRLYLRPIEKLAVQQIDSVKIESVPLDDKLDELYKPGLYMQTETFLNDVSDRRLITIQEQLEHMDIYERIEGGMSCI